MVRVGGTRPVAPEFGPQPSFPLSVKSRGPSDRPWRGKPAAALGLFARSFASGGIPPAVLPSVRRIRQGQ